MLNNFLIKCKNEDNRHIRENMAIIAYFIVKEYFIKIHVFSHILTTNWRKIGVKI